MLANKHIQDEIFDAVACDAEAQKKSSLYRAQLRYTLRRAKKRLCAYGGCKNKAEGYMCKAHKVRTNAKRVAWYHKRMNGGKSK